VGLFCNRERAGAECWGREGRSGFVQDSAAVWCHCCVSLSMQQVTSTWVGAGCVCGGCVWLLARATPDFLGVHTSAPSVLSGLLHVLSCWAPLQVIKSNQHKGLLVKSSRIDAITCTRTAVDVPLAPALLGIDTEPGDRVVGRALQQAIRCCQHVWPVGEVLHWVAMSPCHQCLTCLPV
jgi:hypothetical protein